VPGSVKLAPPKGKCFIMTDKGSMKKIIVFLAVFSVFYLIANVVVFAF